MHRAGDVRVGQYIDGYRLERFIGRGGFADVYQGIDSHSGKVVAVKLLRLESVEDFLVEDFLKEGDTIAHLHHRHIVRVYSYGVEGAYPYLIMEYVPNGSLRARYAKGTRLSPGRVIEYVGQAASGLYYAHRKRLIHRDIKPENMLLDQRNGILLSDFGLALWAEDSRSQTAAGREGTIAYMAPEQIEGRVRLASDQYALGIVAYEWLCGHRPFRGTLTEIVAQHLHATPPSLWTQVPDLSPALEKVVFKALAKEPDRRFENVEAFAEALKEAYRRPLFPPVTRMRAPQHVVKRVDFVEEPLRGRRRMSIRPTSLPAFAEIPLQRVRKDIRPLPRPRAEAAPRRREQSPAPLLLDDEPVPQARSRRAPTARKASGGVGVVLFTVLLVLFIAGTLWLAGNIANTSKLVHTSSPGTTFAINQIATGNTPAPVETPSTPAKTLVAVCAAIQKDDAQALYALLSTEIQAKTSVNSLARSLADAGEIKTCSYSSVQVGSAGNTATAQMMIEMNKDGTSSSSRSVKLVLENTVWKLDEDLA